ncbi:hypothetical protein OSTOST_08419 [Ostertagia ostertagi]
MQTELLACSAEDVLQKVALKETPQEYMANIILYIDTLEYASIPDYDHIAAQLEASMEAYNLSYADPPDWDLMVAYLGPRYEKNPPYILKCNFSSEFYSTQIKWK